MKLIVGLGNQRMRRYWLGLLVILGVGLIVFARYIIPEKETVVSPLEIPLGIGAWDSETVEFFNQYAKADDQIGVRPQYVDLLDRARVGKKSLVFPYQEDPSEIISLAKEKGVEILGYNLEKALSKEEMVAEEKEFYNLAKENDLLFVFAPTALQLELNYRLYAPHADVIGLQSQRYQTQKDYEKVVEDLIGRIKATNPEVMVSVQVSVNPPGNRTITAGEVIQNIQAIKDKADSIIIFYHPNLPERASVMKEVFKKLRSF